MKKRAWTYEIHAILTKEKDLRKTKDYTLSLLKEPSGNYIVLKETKYKNHKELYNEFYFLSLLNHSGILKSFDFFFYPQWKSFLVLEYLNGGNLKERIKEKEKFDFKKFAIDLFDILSYLEKNGVIHADIKPENILFTHKKSFYPVLSDFGFASFTEKKIPRGSIPYCAPEVLSGESPTHKSDMFSAGIVLYELVTGEEISFRTYESLKDFINKKKWKNRVKDDFWINLFDLILNPDPQKRLSATEILEKIFSEKRTYFNDLEILNQQFFKDLKNKIKENISKRKGGIFLVKGQKGTGKSFILRNIYTQLKENFNGLLIDKGKLPYLNLKEENLYPFLITHLLNLKSDLTYFIILTDPPLHKKTFINFLNALYEVEKIRKFPVVIEIPYDFDLKGKVIEFPDPDTEKIVQYIENNTGIYGKEKLFERTVLKNKGDLKKVFTLIKEFSEKGEIDKITKAEVRLKKEEKEVLYVLNIFGQLNTFETKRIFGERNIKSLLDRRVIERIGGGYVPLSEIEFESRKGTFEKILKNLKDIKKLSLEGRLLFYLSAYNLGKYEVAKDFNEEIEEIYTKNQVYIFTFFENLKKPDLKKIPSDVLEKLLIYYTFKKDEKNVSEVLNVLKKKNKEKYLIGKSLYYHFKGEYEKAVNVIDKLNTKRGLLSKCFYLLNTYDIKKLKNTLHTFAKKYEKKATSEELSQFYFVKAKLEEFEGDFAQAEIDYRKSLFKAKKEGETEKSYKYLAYYIEFLYNIGKKKRAIRLTRRISEFLKHIKIFPYPYILTEFIRIYYFLDKDSIETAKNALMKIKAIHKSYPVPFIEPYIEFLEGKFKELSGESPEDNYKRAIELCEKLKLNEKLIEIMSEYIRYVRIKGDNKKFKELLLNFEKVKEKFLPFYLKINTIEDLLFFNSIIKDLNKIKKYSQTLLDHYEKTDNIQKQKLFLLLLYFIDLVEHRTPNKKYKMKIRRIKLSLPIADIFEIFVDSFHDLISDHIVNAFTRFDGFLKKADELKTNKDFKKFLIIFFNVLLAYENKQKILSSGIITKFEKFLNEMIEGEEDKFLKHELEEIRKEILKITSISIIRSHAKWEIFRNYLIYASKYHEETEFFNRTIEILANATNSERGMIVIKKDDEKDVYEVKGTYRMYKKKINIELIDISKSSLYSASKKGTHFFVPDTFSHPELKNRESIRRFRIRSILCLPLFYEGKPFGAIYLDSRKKREFTEEDMELVRIMADVFTISYQRNLLFDKIKEEKEKIEEEKRMLEQKLKEIERIGEIVGTREFINRITVFIDKIRKLEKPLPILIVGETGTGKTLLADTIHRLSLRKNNPIVFFSFNEFPLTLAESELFGYKKGAFTGAYEDKTGLIEQADNGTLVLENVESIPPPVQEKLLRFLDTGKIRPLGTTREKSVDVMVIATALPDVEEKVKQGILRKDLYYRLKGYYFYIPPLRERIDDIPVLITHFLKEIIKKHNIKEKIRIKHETWKYLYNYSWPGNVRELKFALEFAILNSKPGEAIGPEHFPEEIRKSMKDKEKILPLEEMEKKYILKVLEKTNWNKTETAKILNISRQTLIQKLKKYGLLKKI